MGNSNLRKAQKKKNDEFYTQWKDIENEMNAYLEYNPDVFRDKVVLLPCDDPTWSNFTKYFALRFDYLGLKKLISTSYAPNSNKSGQFYTPQESLFEDIEYDEETDFERGKIFILENDEKTGDGVINIDDIQWEYLQGDGDFRSSEVTKLRDEADFVITNPPFSLFREFVAWLTEGDVKFAIIGTINAITYKEIFPLLKSNSLWLGAGFNNAVGFFKSPHDFEETETRKNNHDGLFRVPGVAWFTNIQHGRRHKPMSLMSMADNRRFNKRISNNESSYKKYDNYDAIEVPSTSGIPSDYEGIMGVPIPFMYKYCPEQFEILDINPHFYSLVNQGFPKPKQLSLKSHGATKDPYARILIKHKNPESSPENPS